MAIEHVMYHVGVCDNAACEWRGNPTPSEDDANESLQHHITTEHNTQSVELDELGHPVNG